jgi:hypothetical protein
VKQYPISNYQFPIVVQGIAEEGTRLISDGQTPALSGGFLN